MLIKHIRKGSGIVIGDLLFQLVDVVERPPGHEARFDVEGLYALGLVAGQWFEFKARAEKKGETSELVVCELFCREVGPTYVELGIEAPEEIKISNWKESK